ncbi:DUF6047 family protein [Bacteroides thetaiotaomicron]|nr:DUF6047 family protein [Bacteroides thetaiotaomicron]
MEKSNRTAPLKVVLRKHGYLLFSGSRAGEEALKRYLQRAADRYFEPHAHDGALEIYEYSGRRRGADAPYQRWRTWHVLPGRNGKGGIHSTGGPSRRVCREPRAKALPRDEPDSRRIPGTIL